ncbi:MAG: hypothetical protein WAU08_14870 [Flavobacteriales bacterium]
MSSFSTFIVTGAQVRDISGTSQNVEDKKLRPLLRIAQQAVETALGRTLYALVETAYVANPATLGGAGMLLFYTEYLVPATVWRVMSDAGIDLAVGYDRNGAFERNGNDYNTTSDRRMSAKTGKAEARADNYLIRMVNYVKALDAADPIRAAYEDTNACDERPNVNRGNILMRRSYWQDNHNQ